MTNSNQQNDYESFIAHESLDVPSHLDESILSTVKKDLNPSPSLVLSKMGIIQAVTAVISLTFCPQFSYSLTNNHEVFHYFHHQFGAEICMIICGTIFLLPGTLLAGILLKRTELQLIRKTWYLEFFAFTAMALFAFFLLGVEFYVKSVFYWLLGAIGTSIILLEAQYLLRSKLLAK